MKSDDCSSHLHEYCQPCDCECHMIPLPPRPDTTGIITDIQKVDGCQCDIKDRLENESEREWFKRWMCMYHWAQTDYYRTKSDDNPSTKA